MTTKQVGCSFRPTEVDSKMDVETGALLRGLEFCLFSNASSSHVPPEDVAFKDR